MSQAQQGRVRFGPFELDPRAGELHKNGCARVLQEQQLKVLLMLIEREGEIATREEIKQCLWPNDTAVEFDHGINNTIKNLRRTLGDSADSSQYIQTVVSRGYRLMVRVEWIGTPKDAAESTGHSSSSASAGGSDSGALTKATLKAGRLTGKVVSHYRVLEVIGSGGMGLVYRAEDLRLGRPVALKFLPEEISDDPKARARFEREAKAVSALSHSNICTVYDFEEYKGHPFIAMELLQGKTLRDQIAEGKFRLTQPEGLKIATQIASGLEAAHEKGIIHRDIKPANIFITEKSVAKILDFGVAKVIALSEPPDRVIQGDKRREASKDPCCEDDPGAGGLRISVQNQSGSLGMTNEIGADNTAPEGVPLPPPKESALTRAGVKPGTAGYMSPEQIRGEPLDARTDLFSFGLVLYEMATGERAFTAEGQPQDVVLDGRPVAPSAKNPYVTPEMEAIIDRCLEKNPVQRFQSAGELRTVLLSLSLTNRRKVLSPSKKLLAVAVVVMVAVMVAALAFVVWLWQKPMAGYVFDKYTMAPLTERGDVSLADISSDGKYLAYTDDESGKQSLWLEQLGTGRSVRLYGPVAGLRPGLRFTPDGNYIYFSQADPDGTGRGLYRIPALGGGPERLRPEVFHDVFYQVGFSPDGRQIVFARRGRAGNSLVIANSDGTSERTLRTFGTEVVAMPAWSPSGRQIAFLTDEKAVGAFNCLAVVSVNGGKERRILHDLPSLFGVAWLPDESGLTISAPPGRTRPGIWIVSYPKGTMRRITSDLSEYFGVSTTSGGKSLVSVQKNIDSSLWVAPTENPSGATRLREGSGRKDGMLGVTWLPDGTMVYTTWEGELKNELWRVSRDGHDRLRLSRGPDTDTHPAAASAAGKIVFVKVDSGSNMWDIWEMNEDGSDARRLTNSPATKVGPDVAPDATWITYATTDGPYKMVLASGKITKLANSGEYPAISPDGKWIAFVTPGDQNDDRIEVVAADGSPARRFFPLPQEPQVPVSANLGSLPLHWAADGKAITYVRTKDGVSNIWAQPVDGEPAHQLTNFTSMYIWRHAWSPDGKYLVMARGNFSRDAVMLTDAR